MKTAFVTGANTGLGYGFVETLLDKGFFVFGGVRKMDGNLPARDNLMWIEIDVTDDASIARARDAVAAKTKMLDILINDAGVNRDSVTDGRRDLANKLQFLDRSVLLKMFDVNAVGPIMMTKLFLDLLNSVPAFIINISSFRASFHPEAEGKSGNYGYRASKLALNMMTWTSLHDLPANVKTFAVHPGNVKTRMNPEGIDDPKVQAGKIIAITEHWDDEFNGKFMRFDGAYYPL